MTLTQTCSVPVPADHLWDFLMEIPKVGQCIPGVESVEPVAGDSYRGSLSIQVGPIRLSLHGTIVVEERDRGRRRASMPAEASDTRAGGGVRARMTMTLTPAEDETRLTVVTDLTILGKLGEFGQPLIKKKADSIMQEFARTSGRRWAVTRRLGVSRSGPGFPGRFRAWGSVRGHVEAPHVNRGGTDG